MSAYIPFISKLSTTIIRILGHNPGVMTLQGTNTYLLGSGRKRILIDAGEKNKPKYVNDLLHVLSSENAVIEHIIISHWHHDHIGGVEDIFNSLSLKNCKVWKYQRIDDVESKLNNIQLHFLENGQEFTIEGATLRVIHTPGHTSDHIVVKLLEENAVFGGDCILGEGTSVFENLYEYMLSLKMILDLNPSIIYPGHGPVIENACEKVQYYINHRLEREKSILALLSDSKDDHRLWSEKEIVKKLYSDIPKNLHIAAAINVKHHLEKLLKENRVTFHEDKWKIRSTL